MAYIIKTAGLVMMLSLILSCEEEEKTFASIEGQWRGTLAELEFRPFGLPVPFREKIESFVTLLEFTPEGVLIVRENGQPTEGTYQLIDDQLITDTDFSLEDFELSGTYEVEKLDNTTLIFSRKKQDKFEDPDGGGSLSGTVEITLHFERIK